MLAAVRSLDVGVDTPMHCHAYQTAAELSFSNLNVLTSRFEPGFVLMCKLLTLLSDNYQLLIVVSSAIICACTGVFIYKLTDEPILPTLLFLCLLFPNYLNIMREGIAIAIGMLAIVALKDRKRAVFVVLVLLATSFHRSAIVLLSLLFLRYLKINWKSIGVFLVCTVLCFILANQVLQAAAGLLGKSSFYDENFMESNYFGALIQLLFDGVLTMVFFNYLGIAHRKAATRISSSLELTLQWGLLLWLAFSTVGMKVEIVSRFGYYFAPLILIALPYALKVPTKSEAVFVRYALVVTAIAYFAIIESARPEWHGIVPYTADISNMAVMLAGLL